MVFHWFYKVFRSHGGSQDGPQHRPKLDLVLGGFWERLGTRFWRFWESFWEVLGVVLGSFWRCFSAARPELVDAMTLRVFFARRPPEAH